MAGEIVTAANGARREDARLVAEARAGLDQVAREISNRLASARRGDEQNRWLLWAGLGGLVLGLLFYALMAGPIARLAPASWLWPERMAARIVAEPTPWDAGTPSDAARITAKLGGDRSGGQSSEGQSRSDREVP